MKKRILSILLCLCMVMALLPTTALAAGEGAGSTSISNFKELKDAFRDGGEYTLAANITVTEQLTLESGKTLTIHGNGHTIQPEVTGLNEQGIVNDDASAIDNIIKNSGTLTLENLTIYGGNGRCIANNSYGTLTMTGVSLERAHFIGRYEFDFGAGLYNSGSAKALLTNCNIRRNGCDRSGGGFYNAGTLILESCAIVENRNFGNNKGGGAGENSGASGSTAQLYMNNCTVANNQSSEIGGGLNNFSGTAYIMNSTFTGNVTTKTYDYYGGGIGNNQGKVYAVNSAFAFNYANGVISDIGIYNSSNKDVFLYNCAYGTIRKSPSSDPQSSFVSACQKLEGEVSSLFNGARNSGIVDKNGVEDTSTTFDRPVITSVGSTYGVYPAAAESSALKFGAVKTYYECDSTNFTVKMSYGDGESPTQLGNLGTTRTAVTRPGGGDTSSLIGAMPANFAITTMYTVKVKPATGGTVTGGSAQGNSYPAGTTGIQITAVPSTGYAFSGWKVNGATDISEPNKTYTINDLAGDVTLTPVFVEANTYTVTYLPGTNGTGDKQTDTKTEGDNLILRGVTFTRTGYTQTGWAISDGGDKAYELGGTYSANAVASLYPVWTANTYTVTWKSQDGNSILETDLGVASGTGPSFGGAAPTKAQDDQYTYTFDGWATSENQESGTAVGSLSAVAGNVTYYAAFSKTPRNYTVTLNTNGGAIADGKNVTSYTYGTPVTLPGVADMTKAGYTFGGWYDNESLTGTAVTTIAADATGEKTFYAKWTGNQLTGTAKITGTAKYGQTLTASLEGGNNTGTLTFTWYRSDESNSIGTGTSYQVQTADIGKTLTCKVTSSEQTGEISATTATVTKADQSAPDAPTMASRTSSSVTLNPITTTGHGAVQYAMNTTDSAPTSGWQTGTEFTGLTASTTYYFFARYAGDENYNPSESSGPSTAITTDPAPTYGISLSTSGSTLTSHTFDAATVGYATAPGALTVTVTNTGSAATGALTVALTAGNTDAFEVSTSSISSITTTNDTDTFTVKPNTGLGAGTYTATVTVSGQNIVSKSFNVSFTVTKANQTAPAAPTMASKTSSSVTLEELPNNANGAKAQYSKDGGATWQDSPAFTGLSANTGYSFVARYGETDNYAASPASAVLNVTTSAAPSGGGYVPTGYPVEVKTSEKADGTVSADRSSAWQGDKVTITVTPDRYYKVDGVIVKDQSGKELDVTKNADGTYSFTMPAGKVTMEAVFSWDNPFTDVAENAYYAPAVEWALKNDITNGSGDGTTFSPDAVCTRAQIVTFLWRAAGCPEPAGTNSFTDVPADAYYAKAVVWAVEQGITNGSGDGTTFSPDAACTRDQMVTFLWRAAGEPESTGTGAVFTDVPADASYAKAAQWALEKGITQGTSTTKLAFSPDVVCTRAQMITFIWRSESN